MFANMRQRAGISSPEYTELTQGFMAWANLYIRLRNVALTLEDIGVACTE